MSLIIQNPYHWPITLHNVTPTSDGIMSAADKVKLDSLVPGSPPNAYVVQPGAANAGTFTTIAAAIAAAVADGVSLANPKAIMVMGGSFTETFALVSGIRLTAIGGSAIITTLDHAGAQLLNCIITLAANQIASMSGFQMIVDGSDSADMVTLAAGAQLLLEDCEINTQVTAGFIGLNALAGGNIAFNNCTVRGGTPGVIQCAAFGNIIGYNSTFQGVGDSVITVTSAQVQLRGCTLSGSSTGGNPLVNCAGTTSSFITHCSIFQLDSSAHAIEIGAGKMAVQHSFFTVVDGGANNCINGAAGAVLQWGAPTFAPTTIAGLGCTNRVATTTIGAGAVNTVVDAITAV